MSTTQICTSSHLRSAALAILTLLTMPACSDPDPPTDGGTGDGGATQCATGLKAVGPACVPIFDECKDDEIPVLGGGCRHVGPPRTCLKGWATVKGGWCEPILPKGKCPIGTMEVIGKTTCQPVGPPTKCLTGWALVTGGWCEPILPKGKCPAGTMEVIGKATCQPIGDCGSGTWGKIKTTASTIFVNQSYSGSSPDGSLAKPYITIGAALKAAGAGAHIAVAAGTYKEDLVIDKQATLEGRCAQMMTITGAGKYTVEVKSSATGSVLRHLAIKGADRGLLVYGASVTADHMAVQGCEGRGIQVQSKGTLTLSHSLVAGNRDGGIVLFGSKATVERGVIRDTGEWAKDKKFGEGISAGGDLSGQGRGSELTLRDSLVAGNRTAGIALWSSKATVERSVVRDTRGQASDQQFGFGIQAAVDAAQSTGSEVILQDSLVANNRSVGILLKSSKATLERTVLRDTHEDGLDKQNGNGISAGVASGQSRGSELTLRDSLVAGNRTAGISLWSSKATVQRSEVRDTRERASDKALGEGIGLSRAAGQNRGSELTLSDSLVAGNRTMGIDLESSKATLQRSVVRDTRMRSSDQIGGLGIMATTSKGQSEGSELILRDSLVAGNRNVGILLKSSKATVQQSVVRDTRERALDKESGVGISARVSSGQSGGSVLTLSDSLVAGNRDVGIHLLSSKASVHSTVVRDTLQRASDKKAGMGIMASVEPGLSQGSELTLINSLVAGNRVAGISLLSSKATVQHSVVRDTLEDDSDKELGMGIAAVGLSGQSRGSELTLSDSLVAGNRTMGIDLEGSKATVQRSVVRDTREQASDKQGGKGIQVAYYPGHSQGSELTLRDSLVAGNRSEGIGLYSSRAMVERSVVRDTRERASDKKYGTGIEADFFEGQNQRSELTLRNSLVANNRNVGIALHNSKATVQRSVVRDTRMSGIGQFGDGLAAEKSTLHVLDTTVERNARAGLLFINSGGSVHRCIIRYNIFAIDVGGEPRPTIGKDNVIVDNKENEVTSSDLKIAPPLKLP